jgi:hypothetical protein
VAEARALLKHDGLLLFSDTALPSLVGIVVGEPLHRSWLGHPRGHIIYAAMNVLDDDPEILSIKLLSGKVTYVHRTLWPAVYVLGRAREAWQLERLSAAARWLLQEVDAEGDVQTDSVFIPAEVTPRKRVADAARELERLLLVHATEVHTPSGAHAKVLQTWDRWSAPFGFAAPELSPDSARQQLEAAARGLGADLTHLPWRRRH